ncbi:tail fiber domain-containing protein [Corallococcus carmarthensis]|uniref:tail fiber domain-containing protein n=1 Tax=Corallococcus carmarthensis TaxID=2316728 RepID=UPI00148CE5E8|nr:tail fiber domain-containing protein [Corallococcus carmarthensis]
MTDPYIKANPGDPILSEHWNTLQVRLIEEIRTHTHLGGTDGKRLGGNGIDPETTLTVKQVAVSAGLTAKQVDVSTVLTVKGLNVADRLTGLVSEKFPVTGGTLSGPLSVTGDVGFGTTTPNKQFTLNATRGDEHAPMEVRATGNTAWGIGLVVRNTGGTHGSSILLRSREKSWQVRGETGASATGFQITEDGGDAEYGKGWGTARLHISAGGNVGLGTAAPQCSLHVASAGNALARIEAGGSGGWAEIDLYGTFPTVNLRRWNLAVRGGDGCFAIRQLSDARGELSSPLVINQAGVVTLKSLTVQGNIVPSAGNSAGSGIQFPSDPGGGSGDQAFIRYFVTGGETTKLRIGIDNDADDSLGLWQMGDERLTVYNGNVGIGTPTPQTALNIRQRYPGYGIRLEDGTTGRFFQIHYENNNGVVVFYHQNGSGHYMTSDGAWNRNSDAALKENLAGLEGTLDKVLQLKPLSFDWKNTGTRDIGFVAQDMEKLFPELVGTVHLAQAPEPRTLKGITYSSLGVLAIAAIQELKARYDETLKDLEARIQALSTRGAP